MLGSGLQRAVTRVSRSLYMHRRERSVCRVGILFAVFFLLICFLGSTAAASAKWINIHVTDNSGSFPLKGVEVIVTVTTSQGDKINKTVMTNEKGIASFWFSDARPNIHILAILRAFGNIIALKSTAAYCPKNVNNVTVKIDYL